MHADYWLHFWLGARRSMCFISALSFTTSLVILFLYCCLPRWRKTPGWLVRRAILCDASSAFVFLLWSSEQGDASQTFYMEKVIFNVIAIVAAESGANAWRMVMFLHLVAVYRNPFQPDRGYSFYFFVVFSFISVCVGSCLIPIRLHDSQSHAQHERGEFRFGMAILFPLVICPGIFVLVGSVLQLGVWSLIRADRRDQSHASVTYRARNKLIKDGFVYLLLHMLQLLLGCGMLAFWWATREQENWCTNKVVMGLITGRPLISHAGWFLLNGSTGRWFSSYRWEDQTVPAARPTAAETTPPAAQRRKGKASTCGASMLQDVQLADLEPAAEPAASSTAAVSSRRSVRRLTADIRTGVPELAQTIVQGVQDAATAIQEAPDPRIGGTDLMSELRFEVLYDVARSIGDYAHWQLQNDALRAKKEPNHAAPQRQSVSCHGFGRRGSAVEHQTSQPVSSSAGLLSTARRPMLLSTAGPEHHEAAGFADIREAFGITPELYAREFPNDLSRLNGRWLQKIRESVSEGASGSFFYRVLSDAGEGAVSSRFIVKEITRKERQALLRILPAYRQHVRERGGQSFIQYLGCHSVPLRWKYSARVNFVVMRNFLPVDMWLVFDLKGATANRRALQGKTLLEVQNGGHRGASYGTLRDWEWMDIAMSVDVAAEDKVEIAEILHADSDFLASQGLLDYSLLLGIHRLPADISLRETRIQQLTSAGGYVSLDRQKVYFFGIVDVLEGYSLRWRAQHWALTTAYVLACNGENADGISAMAPDLYAERFYTFMLKEVLQWGVEGDREEELEGFSFLEAVRGCGCAASCALCCRRPSSGLQRWGKLWRRRRRGLMRERVEAERADYLRRVQELEQELQSLRREVRGRSQPSSGGSCELPLRTASSRSST